MQIKSLFRTNPNKRCYFKKKNDLYFVTYDNVSFNNLFNYLKTKINVA